MGQGKCPICAKAPEAKYKPFCSKRCADIDLHNWFTGRYSAPAEEDDEPGEEDLESE